MRHTFVFFLCLAACSSSAQTPATLNDLTPPPGTSHVEEFKTFVQLIKEVHPEPYRFTSEEEFDQRASRLAGSLGQNQAPTQFEVGRAYHEFLAPLGDFHMQVALPAYQAGQEVSLLPMHLVWVAGAVVVDASSEQWPVGTTVLAIDGEPIDGLWRELKALVIADGKSPQVRRAGVAKNFSKMFHLAKGVKPSYTVRLQYPGSEPQDVQLAGVSKEAFSALGQERLTVKAQGFGPPPPWPTLERPEPGTALVRMQGFGMPKPEEYEARVDAIFDQLGQTKHLILDLRDNQGGFRSHGVHVLNRVLGAPYTQWRGISARVTAIPEPYAPYVAFPFGPQEYLGALFGADAPKKGTVEREGDPLSEQMKPQDGQVSFEQVVVLVDSTTNSAANEFVLALKKARPEVMIVGEEVGGDCDRHVGEYPVVYKAFSSDVVVIMSLISVKHVQVPGCEPGRGLMPQRAVSWSMEDVTKGRDPFLRAALEVLRGE